MGSITTSYATSAKSEHFAAAHCFQGTVTPTANTHTNTTIDTVSTMAGVAVGMSVTGSGVPANAVVASITSNAAFVLSQATSSSLTTTTLTIGGDVFKVALIIPSPTGTYGAASVNYTDITGNSDEVSGSGYTATGVALTNVSPTTSGTTAFVNFSPNPSWTSATFSTAGCMIYNTSVRLGGTSGTNTTGAGRCVGVFSFGGTQTVTAGTLTLLMPSATSSTAIFRIA